MQGEMNGLGLVNTQLLRKTLGCASRHPRFAIDLSITEGDLIGC